MKNRLRHKKITEVKSGAAPGSRRRLRVVQLLVVALLVGVAGVSALLLSSAATGVNIYLSPATTTIQQAGTVNMALRINPNGTNTDGVSATITYDPAKLRFVSVDVSQSAFSVPLAQSTTSNSITITRAIGLTSGTAEQPIKADALVANISFVALAGSGTSSLALSNEQATYNGQDLAPSSTDANLTFTTPPPPSVTIGNLTSNSIVSTDLSITSGQTNLNSSSYLIDVNPVDNSGVGIKQVDLQLDSQPKQTLTTGFNFLVNMTSLSCGTHTLVATVTDKAASPKTGTTTVNFKATRGVDINDNCTVDLADYNAVRSNYGVSVSQLSDPRIDINRNGSVDLSDYSAVRTRYGT